MIIYCPMLVSIIKRIKKKYSTIGTYILKNIYFLNIINYKYLLGTRHVGDKCKCKKYIF